MDIQGIEQGVPVRPKTFEHIQPASRVHVPEKSSDARETAVQKPDVGQHAGANVGIPPALDAHHPKILMDDRIDRLIAQIVDENDVVIRQIPPEEQVKLALRIRQTQGILFDKRV